MATVGGKLKRLPIDSLLLDPQNPRLPDDKRGTSDQLALAEYIAKHYKPIEIGQSIAANGFFESEPLIAVKDNGKYIVKEGNRRLAALKGLTDQAYRLRYPRSKEWGDLAQQIARRALLPGKLPVVVAADEDGVWPIIGYRHVSGIEPWAPLAKAQFIGQRVDAGETWEHVAVLVGESETSVRSHYRNLRVARQMRDEFKVDTSELEDNFGTFTRAMTSVPIRAYVGAPDPKDVSRTKNPLPANKTRQAREIVEWIFGTASKEPVLRESRELTSLASILRGKRSTKVLRETGNFSEAYLLSPGQKETLAKRLENAESLMRTAVEEIDTKKRDEAIAALVKRCVSAARKLANALPKAAGKSRR